jgi:hypothetical protein
VRLEWSGVCASTGWLGVGIPSRGGGGSVRGRGDEGGGVVVCVLPVCAVVCQPGKTSIAMQRSRGGSSEEPEDVGQLIDTFSSICAKCSKAGSWAPRDAAPRPARGGESVRLAGVCECKSRKA